MLLSCCSAVPAITMNRNSAKKINMNTTLRWRAVIRPCDGIPSSATRALRMSTGITVSSSDNTGGRNPSRRERINGEAFMIGASQLSAGMLARFERFAKLMMAVDITPQNARSTKSTPQVRAVKARCCVLVRLMPHQCTCLNVSSRVNLCLLTGMENTCICPAADAALLVLKITIAARVCFTASASTASCAVVISRSSRFCSSV
mmetsp:Transcript_7612/g.23077  ORF Transcript_7612/g.23077 Transcript_7612/m.23077 type:complete len:204 (-) Transcript_7612:933-1544(-)